MGGHQVQVAQDAVLRHEVPGDVQHQSAPAEAGRVLDAAQRQPPRSAVGQRGAPEGVRGRAAGAVSGRPRRGRRTAAGEVHALRRDVEAVALFGQFAVGGPAGRGRRPRAPGASGRPVAAPSAARSQRSVCSAPSPATRAVSGPRSTEGVGVRGGHLTRLGDHVGRVRHVGHVVSPSPRRPGRRPAVVVRVRRTPAPGSSSPWTRP